MAIEFTNKPIKWTNEGTPPSTNLKTNGFQAGYKPPAAVFNNQWHTTGECIDELQTKLSGVDDKKVDKVTGKSLIDESVANKFSEETTIPNSVKLDGNLIINNTVAATSEVAIREYSQGLNGYTFTHKLSEKANTTDVLTKTNTTKFTPTGDYHPATKKYVDDNKLSYIANGETIGTIKIGRTFSQRADGPYSTIIGFGGHTDTNALGSVAIGNGECLANYTVAIGTTVASGDNQLVFGRHNVKDTENKYACIIGNGTSDTARSNAHTVDWNGNGWFAGDVEGAKDGVTHKLSEKANASDVLTKTNTTEFTPTADYQPATKKYVDDNKIAIIDDLNTMSNVAALSAYQGKVLKDEITALPIKSLEGQSVSPEKDTTVTANTGATIVGDIRNRIFASNGSVTAGNVASGLYSTVMGNCATASGNWSTAIGDSTTASGQQSTAMGRKTTASGAFSTAIGDSTTASGQQSTAMGCKTTAFGQLSTATGYSTTANGTCSTAMGYSTTAGHFSTAMGYVNTSLANQFKCGHWAKDGTAGDNSGTTGDAFIIGNGTEGTTSNCFRVTYSGDVYGLSTFKATGADYAEYFEWKDGNPNNEDRRGRLVTLDGEKIRLATVDDDYILGVVSANPCIEGDVYSDDWQGKYLTDVFGQRLTQTVHIPARYEEQEITDPETGETTTENVLIEDEHDAVQWVLNPDYDPEQEYVSREDRKEWSAIGLMGKLVVIDDGTCEVNGFCKAGVNGIATKANDGYRVMARIDDTHIRVLVR